MRGLRYSRALFVLHPYCLSINICNLRKKKAQGGRKRRYGSQRIVVAPLLVQFLVVQCNLQFALCTLHFVLCTLHFTFCTLYFVISTLCSALCTLHFVQCTLHFALGNSLVHRPLCTSWNSTRVKIISLFPSLLVTLSSLFIGIRSLPLLSSVVKKGAWTDILVFAILD